MLQYSSGPDEPASPQKAAQKPPRPSPPKPASAPIQSSTTTTTEAYYPVDESNYGSDNVDYLDYEYELRNSEDYSANTDYGTDYTSDYSENSDYSDNTDYSANSGNTDYF